MVEAAHVAASVDRVARLPTRAVPTGLAAVGTPRERFANVETKRGLITVLAQVAVPC